MAEEKTPDSPLAYPESEKAKTSALESAAEDQAQQDETTEAQAGSQLSALARVAIDAFNANRDYRKRIGVESDMIEDLMQATNRYSSDKESQIRNADLPVVFVGLTQEKCRSAEDWLHDFMLTENPRPWAFDPSPMPELPPVATQVVTQRAMQTWAESLKTGRPMTPDLVFEYAGRLGDALHAEIAGEAKKRAMRMERIIADQMVEGYWREAAEEVIADCASSMVCTLKGPFPIVKPAGEWTRTKDGKWKYRIKNKKRYSFARVSPFDVFPSEGAKTPLEGEFVERLHFDARSLWDMRNVEGYRTDGINAALSRYDGKGWQYLSGDESQIMEAEKRGNPDSVRASNIEGLDYYGCVRGSALIEEGVTNAPGGETVKADYLYEVNVMLAGEFVVAVSFNQHPLYDRPYSCSGWWPIPGSFWYLSIPAVLRDVQAITNATTRALCANLGLSAGPQIVINDIRRLSPGEDPRKIYPLKVWLYENKYRDPSPAMQIVDIPTKAPELIAVMERFRQLADEFTVPRYFYGQQNVGGAARTYGGLQALLGSASRTLKRAAARLYDHIVSPTVRRLYDLNMREGDDELAKGDMFVVPKGPMAMVQREEMAPLRMAFLQQVLASPILIQTLGVQGITRILRGLSSNLQLDVEGVLPDDNALEDMATALVGATQMQPGAAGPTAEQSSASASGAAATKPPTISS